MIVWHIRRKFTVLHELLSKTHQASLLPILPLFALQGPTSVYAYPLGVQRGIDQLAGAAATKSKLILPLACILKFSSLNGWLIF